MSNYKNFKNTKIHASHSPYKHVYKSLGSPLIPKDKQIPSTSSAEWSWDKASKNAKNQFWSTLGRHFVRNRHGAVIHTSARAAGRLVPQTYSEFFEGSAGGSKKRSKKKKSSKRNSRMSRRKTSRRYGKTRRRK